MGALLYFVEGRNVLAPATVDELGLGYALPDCAQVEANNGPGGRSGVVAVAGAAAETTKVGYFPDGQHWETRGVVAGAQLWVGWFLDARPTPADLLRPTALAGHDVELADGAAWRVPIARRLGTSGYSRALPARLKLDDSGRWVAGDVLPEYSRLWSIAETWFDFWTAAAAGAEISVGFSQACDWCAEALAVNYRLSRYEVSALGLLDDRRVYEVLGAVIDWPAFEAYEKEKKTAGGA